MVNLYCCPGCDICYWPIWVYSVLIDGSRIEIMVDQDSENDMSTGYDEGIDVEDTRGMNKD